MARSVGIFLWGLQKPVDLCRFVQQDSRQSSQFNERREILIWRGLLRLNDGAESVRFLFNPVDDGVDHPCSGDRGISWGWH
jgi:hypothetical protein